jgi:3'-phosphoadenosine 5'-phosphosulfate sulfotransferase (PAPS reductase)/FAD synthetase
MEGKQVILSYGGGTNSTALLLEWVNRGKQLDAVIFADTGSEQPKTYNFINKYVKPFCEEKEIPFHTVKMTVGEKTRGVVEGEWEAGQAVAIYDYYKYMEKVPSMMNRMCTDKWKIQPIEKLVKEKYPDTLQLIGIDAGETRRAARTRDPKTGEWVYLYPDKRYPLIDWDVDREGCSKIIKDYGWPSPEKSGCYFCPFQPSKNWVELYKKSPDLFNKSLELESANTSFPKMSLLLSGPKRLDWLKRSLETQTSLFDFGDDDKQIPCACYDG